MTEETHLSISDATHSSSKAVRRAARRMMFGRLWYGSLSRIAPRTAGRKVSELWGHIPGNPGRRKDYRPYPGKLGSVQDSAGRSMVTEEWGAGPLVYLIAGWGGWRGQMGCFVDPLVKAGYRVVGFDALGHGDSDPGQAGPGMSDAGEVSRCFETITAHYGPARGMIAHSLGCSSAANAIRSGAQAERLALISPNPDLGAYAREFCRQLWLSPKALDAMIRVTEKVSGTTVGDLDIASIGKAGYLPSTLIVHDRQDKESPYIVSQHIIDEWPQATLVTTDGLGHQRILKDAEVVEMAVDHIKGQFGGPSA